ncbi:MAG: DUF6491 family protein [Pseudomonadales bacterium]
MTKQLTALCAGLVLATWGTIASAAEMSVEPERCIQLSRVKTTEILGNRQILFELQNGRHYLNTLPYPCPGMRRGTTLLYRTSLDQLCSVDVVTVLETGGGGGFWPGASCGLGTFEPVDEGEIDQLREAAKKSN